MSSSEKNMNAFYRALGTTSCISVNQSDAFSTATGSPGYWPGIVFDVKPGPSPIDSLNEAFARSEGNGDAGMAICNLKDFAHVSQEDFRRYSIFPVEIWPLMELSTPDETTDTHREGYEVRRLKRLSEFDSFRHIVNADLLRGQPISSRLFPDLSQLPGIEFWGICSKDNLAGGLLTFTDEEKMTGLYFIVIRNELRGQGLASALVGCVVQ